MPQQLHLLAGVVPRPPPLLLNGSSMPLSKRARRLASSIQASLFACQAVSHEALLLPNTAVASSPPPDMPPSPPTAVASTDDMQHVGITAQSDKAKARDLLTAIRTLKAIEAAWCPAAPDERQALARFSWRSLRSEGS